MFKIGDFSKLVRVSVRMLRHYDEIGLLKPGSTDAVTGYRYYSVEQIPRANRIQVLKEMGFSLAEISGLMHQDLNAGQLLSLLENRKRQITEVIESEHTKLRRVEFLINQINKEDMYMNYEVTVKQIPAYKVLALRDTLPAYNAEGTLWNELGEFVQEHHIKVAAPCYAVYYDEGYKERDVDVEVTMCFQGQAAESDRIKIRELEPVSEMACILHHGPFEQMSAAYHALGVWLDSNGYRWSGPHRAIYHKGPWTGEDPAGYLTEIQAPVTKK
ncbi:MULTISPECIES: MerR family transcriptional regulator [Paenibacillus]|uniref:MerR family transcriptional regulator n=1 Tax=Paenibacillus TaxID=44249 RepID=UPI002FE0FE11